MWISKPNSANIGRTLRRLEEKIIVCFFDDGKHELLIVGK
jgi:hypothetical protein